MFCVIAIVAVLTVLAYFYIKTKKVYSYWEERGVVYLKPKKLLGFYDFFQKKCWFEKMKELYDAYPETRYHGAFMFLTPFLVLKDPNLIKQITIKEFDHFTDRRTVCTPDIDPLWANNLVNSAGEKWRDLRNTLSPAFTGSKMRNMFHLMEEIAEQFIEHFKKSEAGVVEVEMKDAFTRYTNDVIATTAFGLRVDSLKNQDNEFYKMGKSMTSLSPLLLARFMIYMLSPTLMRLFGIRVVPPRIAKYFTKIIEETVKTREEENIVRPDMIHLLMEASKGHKNFTSDDITANAFIFFVAGFETVSTLLTFTSYELAINPDIQDKLRAEIDSIPGKATYETLHGMKYLDMVVSESLRKWIPALLTDRKVTKPFTIQPERPGEKALHLEVGTHCLIPLSGLHRDPKYYPEPEKFDPERFSEENRDKLNQAAYLPFGGGPRSCIGNRFALMEAKLLLFHVLKKFEIVPVEKTKVPVVLEERQFGLNAKGGMWLGLKKI